ncbi:hypothetical protein JDV02_006846 [Purpureocillium takamizusanense]|uniref:Uncharacterized protein n=1 Tax=Purpureocillium takamizusanense TaxID=2060973 RepID=A0A9Q8QL36_9HYPO|nr:uncharacterized protein JDV02_006846 [Purpureocillium takamizusanense]UNI20791.1 hypothetical protein JDV02_006846 [Purpureocillium takamizusanense]
MSSTVQRTATPITPTPSATSTLPVNYKDDGGGVGSQPLLWVVIPLLAVFAAGCFTVFVWTRHRRSRGGTTGGGGGSGRSMWPDDRILLPSGFIMARTGGRRWADRNRSSRDLEGLNELGEPPPPYDTKKPPSINCRYDPVDGAGTELRSMEGAGVGAPEHVAPPPEAHVATAPSRRSI